MSTEVELVELPFIFFCFILSRPAVFLSGEQQAIHFPNVRLVSQ